MKKHITDLELRGKKVLVRLDLNVPMNKRGQITSTTRIEAALETLRHIIDHGGRAIVFSHLGRVKTKEDKEANTLAPVAAKLAELLGEDVKFVPQTRGKRLEATIDRMKDGEVVVVENTRFEDLNGKLESGNDAELGKYWASLGDVFINDAFGTAHRAHASNVGIATYIKESALGFLVKKEIQALEVALHSPERPYIAIVGGAKVSDKIEVLKKLVDNVDKLVIGGAMAYTFMAAQGVGYGNSLVEKDKIELAREFIKTYHDKLILPIDHAISREFKDFPPQFNSENPIEIPATFIGMDIGPETIKLIKKHIVGDELEGIPTAKTLFWNGPMGVTEFKNYQAGTHGVVEAVKASGSLYSVVGGGDSVAAIETLHAADYFSHISTGGGASIEFIEGKELPGWEVIQDRDAMPIDLYEHSNVYANDSLDDVLVQEPHVEISRELDAYADTMNMSSPEVEVHQSQDLFLDEEENDFSELSTIELEQSLLNDLEVIDSKDQVHDVVVASEISQSAEQSAEIEHSTDELFEEIDEADDLLLVTETQEEAFDTHEHEDVEHQDHHTEETYNTQEQANTQEDYFHTKENYITQEETQEDFNIEDSYSTQEDAFENFTTDEQSYSTQEQTGTIENESTIEMSNSDTLEDELESENGTDTDEFLSVTEEQDLSQVDDFLDEHSAGKENIESMFEDVETNSQEIDDSPKKRGFFSKLFKKK
ncbi:phosphoglycerate kinase [Mycoplasma testudineum]|uniref:Phosphoglycerate kinase n=1 Tax=Mycoplasma testudineum TaxID=244584 RepID=A0A4R6IHB0_9MOLU|nr:phosphoglycerate kinase [Mycoplasma testudineum]TDO21207.1 phosphoglycerate kinase [Mycoplasma testudineum]